MIYTLEFEILGLPKPGNRLLGSHWRTRSTHANKWKQKVFTLAWPQKPPAPLAKAKLTLTRVSSVEPDFDGLVSSFKSLIDGLVQAKVIVNDRQENIGQPTYLWEKGKPVYGKVRIRVEEICES